MRDRSYLTEAEVTAADPVDATDEATDEIEGRSEGEGGVVRLSVGAVNGS